MNPEIPGPVCALQLARLWTASEAGWAEALLTRELRLGMQDAGKSTLAGEPRPLRSAPPLHLRRRLDAALHEWPESIDTDPPLRPRMLRLQRDGVLPLGESLTSMLAEVVSVKSDALALARAQQWLESTLRDYRGFELGGNEVGAGLLVVRALTSLLPPMAAHDDPGGMQRGRWLRQLLTAGRGRRAPELATLACRELQHTAGGPALLVALADALVPPCISAFEQAKQVGLEDPSVDPDVLMRRVSVEPHLMLSLWDRLHEALHLLAPQLHAGSLLLRVLVEPSEGDGVAQTSPLSADTVLRLQRALSSIDDLAAVVLNSLLQAVCMQDPAHRAMYVRHIRQERERAGEPGVRHLLRHLIEQQALFPRALRTALIEASRDVE